MFNMSKWKCWVSMWARMCWFEKLWMCMCSGLKWLLGWLLSRGLGSLCLVLLS